MESPFKMLENWKRPGFIGQVIFFISLLGIIAIPVWYSDIREHPVDWYRARWCQENQGQEKAKMPDQTTCGCLTRTHAVEFVYADGWYEALGQALYNAQQSGKKAGIVLIIERESDEKFRERLEKTITGFSLPVDFWQMKKEISR